MTVAASTTILLIEDNPADARLVHEMLREASTRQFLIAHVTRLSDAVARLYDMAVDVILLDLSLPDAQGLDAVARVRAVAPHVPVVVMSGCDDTATAVQGVREGAQDYLVKGRVDADLLTRALHYAIERQRAEDRLDARTWALEVKTREHEAFVYTVAHDLRAPLVSLQGMADILLKDYGNGLADDARLYLSRIVANADKMHAMLNDLLEIARRRALGRLGGGRGDDLSLYPPEHINRAGGVMPPGKVDTVTASGSAGLHICLVEDDLDHTLIIKRAIREAHAQAEVHAMSDGEAALAHLRGPDSAPDLILLDINMPGLSGLDVLAALKADQRLKRIPVVMLTSSALETDVARAYELGASGYISKPSYLHDLRAVLGNTLLYWSAMRRATAGRSDES